MNCDDLINVLNRLLRIVYRSLPVYLVEMKPWPSYGSSKARELLLEIASDDRTMAARVAEAIHDQGGRTEAGQFPIEFSAVHDLELEFLIKQTIDWLKDEIAAIQRCADDLTGAPPLRSLAEETLATARRHLRSLQELTSTGELRES